MDAVLFERWLAKVDKHPDGCWMWTGSDNGKGYGELRLSRHHKAYAHRLSFEHFKGPIPPGYLVRHTCHRPGCVNPDHLLVGTEADNHDDMKREMLAGNGRRYKLTAQNVRAIRADPRSGTVIAKELGVDKSTIALVRHRKTWAFVP